MIEEAYELEFKEKPTVLMEYLSNPENLVKYFEPAKKMEKIGPNEWILYLHWFKTVKSKLTTVITNNSREKEIEFVATSLEWPKFNMALKFYILPTANMTKIRIKFIYDGPLENISRKKIEEAYRTMAINLNVDIKKYCEEKKCYTEEKDSTKNSDNMSFKGLKIYEMKTVLRKEIKNQN